MSEQYMVFDVESIGLHGEGFAVGMVQVRSDGTCMSEFGYACPPEKARGTDEGRRWVAENTPRLLYNCADPAEVRWRFWQQWSISHKRGALLVADCPWPVEARFLAACVGDFPEERAWNGPYPLIDVASVRLAAGLDPLGTEERLPDELPVHDPLADARQSARLFLEALKKIQDEGITPYGWHKPQRPDEAGEWGITLYHNKPFLHS